MFIRHLCLVSFFKGSSGSGHDDRLCSAALCRLIMSLNDAGGGAKVGGGVISLPSRHTWHRGPSSAACLYTPLERCYKTDKAVVCLIYMRLCWLSSGSIQSNLTPAPLTLDYVRACKRAVMRDPALTCCVLGQLGQQVDEHLTGLAHAHLGTRFLRVPLPRGSRLPQVLGLKHSPGDQLSHAESAVHACAIHSA